ncbi:DUF1566 domain-containing protein [Desulfovibrio sp.]|uniref:Lcl domain-containing protein n=1 Tax=Desulfovibrio sp. TaxID=885 RepID=UPI0025C3B628|nr:DUF1566 domain-containing protein [Desulfovibrio sp.]
MLDSGGTCVSGTTTLAKDGSCTTLVKASASASGSITSTLTTTANKSASINLAGTATGFDPCSGSPTIPTTCTDGTIYVGQSNGTNLYIPANDNSGGVSWNGGTWSNTGANSTTDGRSNTNLLIVANGTSGSFQAALLCKNLNSSGHADWYLPAQNELNTIWQATQLGTTSSNALRATFNQSGTWPAGNYWSSTEYSGQDLAMSQRFTIGDNAFFSENNYLSVRCARR